MPPKRKKAHMKPLLMNQLIFNVTMTDISTTFGLEGMIRVPIQAPPDISQEDCVNLLKMMKT
jgi:hypothetical protein